MEAKGTTDSGRKRGRTNSKETESPPNKKNTRSVSRARKSRNVITPTGKLDAATARNLVDEIILVEEEEEEIAEELTKEENDKPLPSSDEPDNMTNETPQTAESVEIIPEMAKKIGSKLAELPTKIYLDEKLNKIDKKADENGREIAKITDRVERLERGERPMRNPNETAPFKQLERGQISSRQSEIEEEKDIEFDKAGRSSRFWPIHGNTLEEMTNGVDAFLREALVIEEEDMNTIIIENITRLRSAPRSRQYDEVLVLFRDNGTRELILSYARNLSSYTDDNGDATAGVRMEIPKFLHGTHKLLDTYGYDMRLKYGKGTRRIIKFDQIERSLLLAYKPPLREEWTYISPAEGRSTYYLTRMVWL